MPRYFFHYRDKTGITLDADGQEFEDLDGARREAVEAAKDAIRDAIVGAGPDLAGASYEITDENGWVMAVVPIISAIDHSPPT